MRRHPLTALCALVVVLFAGCGVKPEQRVVDVCLRDAKAKLGNQDAEIDEKSMRASVTHKPDGTWEVGGFVWFERGMQNERKQTIVCHARDADAGKSEPEVTLLQFLW